MPKPKHKFDVSRSAIAWRLRNRKIGDVMEQLVNNNICFYTTTDGHFNENYVRTLEIILNAFGEPDA